MRLFTDTSYWLALLDRSDSLHRTAVGYAGDQQRVYFYTSDLVVVELMNAMSKRGIMLRRDASQLAARILVDPRIALIDVDQSMLEAALALYADRLDKAWSLTDCASFIIMQGLGITAALTYDRHFEQAGFTALLRETG